MMAGTWLDSRVPREPCECHDRRRSEREMVVGGVGLEPTNLLHVKQVEGRNSLRPILPENRSEQPAQHLGWTLAGPK